MKFPNKKFPVAEIRAWFRQYYKRILLIGGGVLLSCLMLVQLFYPRTHLLPFTTIDGQQMSAWKKADAQARLDTQYAKQKVAIYYGARDDAYQTPQLKDIGLKVQNQQRLENMKYPLLLRFVPTSVFWAHAVVDANEPQYERDDRTLRSYVNKALGESCNVAPKNASLTVKNNALSVVKSSPGGTCELDEVIITLSRVEPLLPGTTSVRMAVKETPAKISDEAAKKFGQGVTARTKNGIPLQVQSEVITISQKDAFSWMEFSTAGDKLHVQFNAEKATSFFTQTISPKVYQAPGTTTVTTVDFQETAREVGPNGRQLDLPVTLAGMAKFAEGEAAKAEVITAEIPAKVVFNRTYSPTDAGLSALIANYAKDNPGRYGISLIELSGKRRRASYNGDMKFTTASTYKLFVAYSTLKRAETGQFKWDMPVSGGRNLEKCFNDMIVYSDNACAESLVEKIGYRPLTNEASGIGMKNTTFVDKESYKTSADDLATFVASLESGELLQGASRTKLLDAMNRNIYRQGIPAGASGQVADKVGFLDNYLHDAGIVYSPSGTYALAIMTEGSSWGRIADLTKKLEDLRTK